MHYYDEEMEKVKGWLLATALMLGAFFLGYVKWKNERQEQAIRQLPVSPELKGQMEDDLRQRRQDEAVGRAERAWPY